MSVLGLGVRPTPLLANSRLWATYGALAVTVRAGSLERLILEADKSVTDGMDADSEDRTARGLASYATGRRLNDSSAFCHSASVSADVPREPAHGFLRGDEYRKTAGGPSACYVKVSRRKCLSLVRHIDMQEDDVLRFQALERLDS
jgi:hypothetical protein